MTQMRTKLKRGNCSTKLRKLSERDNTFFDRLITGDETWVHHYEQESKSQSMERPHMTSLKLKKLKAQKSAEKIMANIFWDAQEVILVDFLPRRKAINSEAYIQALKKHRARIQ